MKSSVAGWLGIERWSWRWKLPLLFAGVAVLTVTAFGVVAYREVKQSAIQATFVRIRSSLIELSTTVQLGAQVQLEVLESAAKDPAFQGAVTQPGTVSDSMVIAALDRLRKSSGAVHVAEVLNSDGQVLFASPDINPAERPDPAAIPDSAMVGPMYRRDTWQFFSSIAPVRIAGRTVGAVRVLRRLGHGSSANSRMVAGVLGAEAGLIVGNQSGNLWKRDQSVTFPRETNVLVRYTRNDTAWVGASRALPGTPWLYAIELPETVALAPAHSVVPPFVLAGLMIAVAGMLIGVRISRTITDPLIELTAAAESIAGGQRNVSIVATDRVDEFGRLSRAFQTMATNVQTLLGQLEADVQTTTGELGTAVDRLRLLHDELQKSERLASLGRVYGSVGHELRNPLGVMSNVVMLLDGLPDASPRLTQYAGMLGEQIRLSQRIISELLDHARSGAPVYAPTDISQLLDELLLRVNVPANIRVERKIESTIPPVALDRDQAGQILWNLITNALHSMQDSGGVLTVGARIDADQLHVSVQDTGRGIPATDAERIFEPLFTTKAEGVGLGLSISREFARAHGGDLYLDATGPGACFVLRLPVSGARGTDSVVHQAGRSLAAERAS